MTGRAPHPSSSFVLDAVAIASVRDRVRFLVDYGALAPSGAPWVLTLGARAIELRIAHRCAIGMGDPAHGAAIIGCGLGLGLLRSALHALGCAESTITAPDDAHPDLLARVFVDESGHERPGTHLFHRALTAAIAADPAVDRAFVEELAAHAEMERARFTLGGPWVAEPIDRFRSCFAPTFLDLSRSLPWFVADRTDIEHGFRATVSGTIEARGDGVRERLAAGQALARIALRARVDGFLTCIEAPPPGADGPWRSQVRVQIGTPRRAPARSRVSRAGDEVGALRERA